MASRVARARARAPARVCLAHPRAVFLLVVACATLVPRLARAERERWLLTTLTRASSGASSEDANGELTYPKSVAFTLDAFGTTYDANVRANGELTSRDCSAKRQRRKGRGVAAIATSLAVGAEGSGGLLGMDERLRLGDGTTDDDELAAQLDDMLQSEGFADLVDRVVNTPSILAAVDDAAHKGTAPDAADLLPAITEAVCAGSGLSAAECAEVEKSAAERLNRLGFLDGDGSGGLLWRTVERLAYFATRLGASGLGGALVLAPVVALFLALFLAFAVKALAHNLQRLFGRKKKGRKRD